MKISYRLVFEGASHQKVLTRKELYHLNPSEYFTKLMWAKLGLLYDKGNSLSSDLCLLFSKEIQEDYKISYSKEDLLNYIFSNIQENQIDLGSSYFRLPLTNLEFFL
jgi:hypothetical protein